MVECLANMAKDLFKPVNSRLSVIKINVLVDAKELLVVIEIIGKECIFILPVDIIFNT